MAVIEFSGGEPLLNFEVIKRAVEYTKREAEKLERKVRYSIITNGSLVTDEILEFFEENRFDLQFSFDSLLQNRQRKNGSFKQSLQLLEILVESRKITLTVAPVFTAKSADKIFDSLMFIKEKNVRNISMGLDLTRRWNIQSRNKLKKELTLIKNEAIKTYKMRGKPVIKIFSDKNIKGIYTCGAGDHRFSISPDGEIWGCPSFTHMNWNKVENENRSDYFYGNINDPNRSKIGKRFKRIHNNYKRFRTDNFYTSKSRCFLCPYLEECKLCPAINKDSDRKKSSLFFVPEYICEINKIIYDSKRSFLNSIKQTDSI